MGDKQLFLDKISQLLDVEEYWYEFVMDEVIALGNALSPHEWNEVCRDWLRLEPLTQERLAQIAADIRIGESETIDMLVQMLSSGVKDVVDMSVDSLHTISQDKPERLNKEGVKDAISQVKVSGAPVLLLFGRLKTIVDSFD